MSIFSSVSAWLAARGIRRRYRYPAMAEANKALMAVEAEVTDFTKIAPQMEAYKNAQVMPERDRDLAYIPIYLSLEAFVASQMPPVIKQKMNREEIRQKVRSVVDLNQMSESFRLILLPENEQTDHLLKIGALSLLRFLVVSLGPSQLLVLIKQIAGNSPLSEIKVNDDGVSFEAVHQRFRSSPTAEVISTYKQFYEGLFTEIKNLFGEKEALDLVATTRMEISGRFNAELLALYDSVLPATAKVDSTVTQNPAGQEPTE